MSLDLEKIEKQLDEALKKDTKESLLKWLDEQKTKIERQPKAVGVQQRVKPDACGQKLLKAILEMKYNPDINMMPTVKKVQASNGKMITYLRYDAVVKYCNENFISKHSI